MAPLSALSPSEKCTTHYSLLDMVRHVACVVSLPHGVPRERGPAGGDGQQHGRELLWHALDRPGPTHYDVLDGEEIAVNQRTLGGHGWNVIHQARRLHALDAAAQRQPRGERLASDPDGNAKKRKGKSTTITKRHRGACACF